MAPSHANSFGFSIPPHYSGGEYKLKHAFNKIHFLSTIHCTYSGDVVLCRSHVVVISVVCLFYQVKVKDGLLSKTQRI